MLFTYSPNSLAENWLNTTIIEILDTGMQAVLDDRPVPTWPDSIPENRRAALQGRPGIRTRLVTFWTYFSRLSRKNKEKLLASLREQTSLPNILWNDTTCTGIDKFPKKMREATVELFRFLFEEQLTTLKIDETNLRDKHYAVIYAQIPSRICPFCGLGYFRAPGAPRNALDHYMAISKYPFAGADLRNLPPMCSECNSDYKKSTDILVGPSGNRERCVDPYLGPGIKITLAGSVPFAGPIKDGLILPKWKIEFFNGPKEQSENWDRVFKVRLRYERDILNAEFRSWLEHFKNWYVGGNHGQISGDQIAAAIPTYIDTVIQDGLAERAFLKAEVFRLLFRESAMADRGPEMKAFLETLIVNA